MPTLGSRTSNLDPERPLCASFKPCLLAGPAQQVTQDRFLNAGQTETCQSSCCFDTRLLGGLKVVQNVCARMWQPAIWNLIHLILFISAATAPKDLLHGVFPTLYRLISCGARGLHYAAGLGHLEAAQLLVRAGAPLDAVEREGSNPVPGAHSP
jgi:hypothetical protein